MKTILTAAKWVVIGLVIVLFGLNSCVRVFHKERDVGIIEHWLFHRTSETK